MQIRIATGFALEQRLWTPAESVMEIIQAAEIATGIFSELRLLTTAGFVQVAIQDMLPTQIKIATEFVSAVQQWIAMATAMEPHSLMIAAFAAVAIPGVSPGSNSLFFAIRIMTAMEIHPQPRKPAPLRLDT
jgi:hypothetical protein